MQSAPHSSLTLMQPQLVCSKCHSSVVALDDTRIVLGPGGYDLVAELSALHPHGRLPHRDAERLPYKTGKLRCLRCDANWGNIQTNVKAPRYLGREVALLRWAGMRFQVGKRLFSLRSDQLGTAAITPEAVAEVGRAVGYRAPPSSLDTFTGDLLASLCEAPDGELCLQFHQCRL
eukprot:EG_transcript_27592